MNSSSILLFAGTTEGRLLAQALAEQGRQVVVCVATHYGEQVIPPRQGVTVHTGRMNREEIAAFMAQGAFFCVVDATHPYAVEVTQNIRSACKEANLPYYRLLRAKTQEEEGVVQVKNPQQAAEYLAAHPGNALLATGSKDLQIFAQVPNFSQRLYPRILPMAKAVENCCALGYQNKNIIAMQGPFSKELNIALLRQINGRYLVTKNSGDVGGFLEKQQAAKEAGAVLVVVERPEEEGFSYQELLHLLTR